MKIYFLVCCLIFNFMQLQAQTWSVPVDVSDPLFNASPTGTPSVAVDSSGNAITVWASQESGLNLIKAARFDATAQTWSLPVTIGSDNSGDAHVAVTTGGKAIAVWSNANTQQTIYSNMFDGTNWIGEQIVDTNATYQSQFYPRVAVDEQGNAFCVWQVQGGNLARVIRSATFSFVGNTWSVATNISTDYGLSNSFVAQPEISANAAGIAVAVWLYQDTATSHYKVQANCYSSGSWLASGSEEDVITSSSDTAEFAPAAVVVAPNGSALSLWPRYNGTQSPTQDYSIMNSVRDFGSSTWSSPVQISALGNTDVSKLSLDLSVNDSNNALGVWTFQDGNALPPIQVIQASSFNNLAWSGTVTTLSDPSLISLFGTVAINSAGDGYALWTTSDFSTFFSIQASKYDQSSDTWETPQTISDPGLLTSGPNQISSVASNANGDFFALWFHIGSTIVVQSAYTALLAPPQPPSNFTGVIEKNKFLNRTECFLEASWSASPSSNVSFYRIYKNDREVAAVSASAPLVFETYLHHCHHAKEYAISSVSADLQESEHIEIRILHE